ncbi:hypothetical protein N9Y92_02505, partial [Chlamydiales bacterium]|nr:hypothetical protein [Chlamydiales bacterium]
NGETFKYSPNRLEKIGHTLRLGIGSALDLLLREIKNPITIVAFTALALLAATIGFYPATALAVVTTIVPFASAIQPWMIKLALYLLVQSTILGVGTRTLGRFDNPELLERWNKGDLEAVLPGDKRA